MSSPDPLLGRELGSWRLDRVLGEGGMGRVYLGVQPAIGGHVAIKVLSEACARDRELVERFFAEARAVNLIRHESIVNVLDLAWLDDGRPYIVMEYIVGETLAARIARGPMPIADTAALVGEVLDALAAAHTSGVVHRDLKPDNVLVTAAGHPKILDFGIAKLAPQLRHGDSPRTATGALLGTPDYMAPEQIAGGAIDGRADLYALGAVLYECVTGRRPFAGANLFELLRAHVEATPPSPRALRPDLPAAFEDVIVRAMAKRPDDRYRDAAAMAAALTAAVRADGPTTPASLALGRTHAVASPFAIRARRRWIIGGALAAAAIAAAVIGAVVATSSSSSSPGTADHVSGPRVIASAAGGARLDRPRDYDPRRFDARAYLPKAEALARALAPDAALITFDVDGVGADGLADLTLAEGWNAVYDFRSAAASGRGDAPPGVPVDRPCLVHVYVEVGGVEAFVADDGDCTQPLRPPPRCPLATVRERVVPEGRAGAVVQIDYLWDGWFVQLGDELSVSVRDDC